MTDSTVLASVLSLIAAFPFSTGAVNLSIMRMAASQVLKMAETIGAQNLGAYPLLAHRLKMRKSVPAAPGSARA